MMSEEHKIKISNSLKGHKTSEETKRKIGLANSISQIGIRRGKPSNMSGKHHTTETKKKISKSNTGRKLTDEVREVMSKLAIKRGLSTDYRIMMSKHARSGKYSNLWKGGITPENMKIRSSIDTRLWREAVFSRDNWTCQKSKIRGGSLCAHHIQNFSQWPELRFAIDNGITFSRETHEEFHKIYGTKNNNREQVIEFLNK